MAKKTTKKPARRFVVGLQDGWAVGGVSSSVWGTMPETRRKAGVLAKNMGANAVIYELVPVAGGRTKP